MKKILISIFLCLMATPVFALDSLGVTDTTGFSTATDYEGYHCCIDTLYYRTGSSDTSMVNAYAYIRVANASGACSMVVSFYDSATQNLVAQSDTLIQLGSAGLGDYCVEGSISGNLSPNTAYLIAAQYNNDATDYVRPIATTVPGWGQAVVLSGQGLTVPADLSGHSANNKYHFAVFITAEPAAGGEVNKSGRPRRLR